MLKWCCDSAVEILQATMCSELWVHSTLVSSSQLGIRTIRWFYLTSGVPVVRGWQPPPKQGDKNNINCKNITLVQNFFLALSSLNHRAIIISLPNRQGSGIRSIIPAESKFPGVKTVGYHIRWRMECPGKSGHSGDRYRLGRNPVDS